MEQYELTIVLPEKATSAKKKAAQDLIEKLTKTLKGKVVKVDDWGELKLSYQMLGNESGIFLHFSLELDKQAVKNINDKLRLEEGFIRYLLVRKENLPSKKGTAR